MLKRTIVVSIFALLIGNLTAATGRAEEPKPHVFLKRGFILNAVGKKCWYTQRYEETNPHFMPEKLKRTTHHDVRTIVFDDLNCMSYDLLGDNMTDVCEQINKTMIKRTITSWFLGTYVLKNANFDVEQIYPPGEYQSRGECIQSKTYPSKGIAIEYFSYDTGIPGVTYMQSLGGCGDPKPQVTDRE